MNLPQGWKLEENNNEWTLVQPDGTQSVALANRWLAIQMYLKRVPFEANHVETN